MAMDSFAYSSRFIAEPPLAKLLLCISLLISQLFIQNPLILLIGAAFAFLLAYLSLRGKFNLVFRVLIINFTIASVLTSIIIAISGNYSLLDFGNLNPNSASLALLFFLRSMLGLFAIVFLASSTPIPQLLYSLKRLGFPKVAIELSSLILGFSYQILDQLFLMERAASSRLGFNGKKRTLNTWGAIFANLFGRSLEMAERKDAGLNSRLYRGTMPIFRPPAGLTLYGAIVCVLPATILLCLQYLI